MKLDPYSILTILSFLVILSYFFNYLSAKLKIPSVLLLIASGIGLKYLSIYFGFEVPPLRTLLEILGITGLIFIVLEAALDLTIEKSKLALIGKSLISAAAILVLNSVVIAYIFREYYNITWQQALLYAVPLSVVSSAIAIPSAGLLDEAKREFIVYESTFSDILGIILFNYLSIKHTSGLATAVSFGSDMVLIVLISILSTFILVVLLHYVKYHVKFFLAFAVIVMIYSTAKFLHLPSLMVVLFFGLALNNFKYLSRWIPDRFASLDRLTDISKELRLVTAETAFIIRTFFFLLFGYSVDMALLLQKEVLIAGLIIVVITVLIRFVFLRYILKVTSAPLTLIAPRGLITVILFYSIPEHLRIEAFSEGILFIVIFATGIMMTVGLAINKQDPFKKIDEVM
ncbi:MAG TPA: cation:proton antiporter [Cyclobacteriaceae bacterium]|nr:cation:proton antiporter [Cyclobacteriaceae bacterium]